MCINKWWVNVSVVVFSKYVYVYCSLFFHFFFSTMPELHINGRSTYHNCSLETNANGASYDTSTSSMVTGRSHSSTIAISTPTNNIDSENSFCGIVFFIISLCFTLVIILAIGIWLVRKSRIMKTQKSQESSESIQLEPLSPPNSIQNCNWTKKHVNDYCHTLIQWNLRKHLTRRIFCVWKRILFLILSFYHQQNFKTETIGQFVPPVSIL